MRVSGSYFYTRIQQAIIFDFSGIINPATDPYGRFGGYRNTGGGLARGFELSVEANPARSITLQSSYTYTNADERQSPVRSGDLRSIRIFDHMFTTTATWRLGRSLDVIGDLLLASDYLYYFGTQMYQFGGPRKADLALSYTRPVGDRRQLRLFTRVENLFNTTWFEDGFSVPKAWATVGIKLLF
jgi:iron complex outermembrane receptor protein